MVIGKRDDIIGQMDNMIILFVVYTPLTMLQE